MNQRREERWLDAQLRRLINTTAPQFDASAWKSKYADQYRALTSRSAGARRPLLSYSRLVWIGMAGGLAAAAVVLLTVGLLVGRSGPPGSVNGPSHPVTNSPVRMVSMMSLSAAFRQGGIEALDRQLDMAAEKLGPRPGEDSMAALLRELES